MATMPREAFLEFFLDGWTPITARQTSPITITRGRLDWAGETSPSSFNAMLDNQSGDLNPDNPLSNYYGKLNRNTPMRFGYVLLRETFGRTMVDGWGSTTPDGVTGHIPTSLAYTLDGTAANFDVGGSTGTIVIAAASTTRHAYLAGLTALSDGEVTVDVTAPSGTGGDCSAGIIFRGSTTSDFWRLSITVTSAGAVTMNIADSGGALRGDTYSVDAASAGMYRLRLGLEGNTIRGKAWAVADPEPYAWQVEYNVDPTVTPYNASGWFGVRARTAVGATNATFTYDNFTIRSVRFFGVTRKISPRSDSTGRNKYAMIEGATALRLIERNAPLLSTLRRGITAAAVQPVAYWSCEDGKDAATFTPAIGAGSIVPVAGVPKPATSDDFTCSDPLPILNGALLAVEMPSYENPDSSAQIRFVLSVPTEGDTPDGGVIFRAYTSGTAAFWDVVYYTTSNGSLGVNAYDQVGTQILTTGATLSDNNGRPARIILDLVQDGADIDWGLTIGPVPTDIDSGSAFGTSGTLTARTFGLISFLGVGSAAGFLNTAFGHLSVHNTITSVLDLRNELGAYAGEKAGQRVERLCAENGIPFTYLGDLDETPKMGPQRPAKLIDLLRECEAADLTGTLLDPRMSPGIFYRTGTSLRGQSIGVTLDYSAGQLTARLEVVHDDQNTRNKITVKRTRGGEYQTTRETGPLNVNDPGDDADGVGVYVDPVTVNVHSESQLPNIGDWLLHLGTFPEPRIPEITVNAASRNLTDALDAALLSRDVDDRIRIQNVTSLDRYDPFDQLVRGYTEVLDTIFSSTITAVGAPEAPYHMVILDDSTSGRLASDTTSLNEDLTTVETGADVAITDGTLWTTTDTPVAVRIGGERMAATAISGASSPQTFTVTRSVNGVVKTHSTGAPVALADSVYLG